ncbi:MAG: alanine racemase [Acidimicrobiales bacterium]|nr:alanine racemase [Acidimicrobiales bacterium]
MRLAAIPTPALVVGRDAFDHNVATMAVRWPGRTLRPHVKAFKSTSLAQELAAAGHDAFCAATVRELEGLARAGLGADLLLANEVLDPERLRRLAALSDKHGARVTVAVDSTETINAAATAGIEEVLIDVDVGLPRCGCAPDEAPRLAEQARSRGMEVRGVMGYEGHVVGLESREQREAGVNASMDILTSVHREVGGDVVSGGGTGTWDLNHWVTELQAGSFTLMDTAYERLGLPFRLALAVLGTVISVSAKGWAVVDVGVKALGMDHGNPTILGASVWFCSDEHTTFAPLDGVTTPPVGSRVLVWPAHIDPTIALHEKMFVVNDLPQDTFSLPDELEITDIWDIDLRNW